MNQFEKRNLNALETLVELVIVSVVGSLLLAGESVLLTFCCDIKALWVILLVFLIFTSAGIIMCYIETIKTYYKTKDAIIKENKTE